MNGNLTSRWDITSYHYGTLDRLFVSCATKMKKYCSLRDSEIELDVIAKWNLEGKETFAPSINWLSVY